MRALPKWRKCAGFDARRGQGIAWHHFVDGRTRADVERSLELPHIEENNCRFTHGNLR